MSETIHFTPTWATEGKPCELRNGTLRGTWDPEGIRDVVGYELRPAGLRISLEIGSQTYCGTGPWIFSTDQFEVSAPYVECTYLQAGVLEMGGIAGWPGGDGPGLRLAPAFWKREATVARMVRVNAVEPWTWSVGDRLSFFVPAERVNVRAQWLFNLPVS